MTANSAIVPPAAVTVIGLGNMGVPMGLRLIKAGFTVTGFDVSETARRNFAAAGGRTAGDVAAAVASTDVVIALLPNGKIVREAVTGLREHLKPSAIVVDMSSSDPIGTRALGGEFIAAGHAFVDAPVSGGVRRAADGTLAIMVGGDGATVERIAALLGAMGTSIFRTGALADGFPLRLMAKDVRTADDMAHALGIATPLADLCAQLWGDAARALGEKANHTEVLRYMEGLCG
jgi:3-hydroxyisobutyrate dehydrogenase